MRWQRHDTDTTVTVDPGKPDKGKTQLLLTQHHPHQHMRAQERARTWSKNMQAARTKCASISRNLAGINEDPPTRPIATPRACLAWLLTPVCGQGKSHHFCVEFGLRWRR